MPGPRVGHGPFCSSSRSIRSSRFSFVRRASSSRSLVVSAPGGPFVSPLWPGSAAAEESEPLSLELLGRFSHFSRVSRLPGAQWAKGDVECKIKTGESL